MAANYKSACLIRSCNQECDPSSANHPLLSALMSSQLYSSLDFGRKWQLIHEHVTPNRFYWWVIFLYFLWDTYITMSSHFLAPPRKKKYTFCREGGRNPLFVFCTTERAILMAENEALLPRRMVMRLEFSTFSCRSDAVSQRLISAIAFWQTACQHSLAPQHLLIVCGLVK